MSNNEDENLGSFYMGKMRPPPEPKRVLPRGVLSGLVILIFVAIIWYAYPQGQEKYTGMDVPVIKADTESYKSKPQDPGGMEIRHQDSTVFDPLEKKEEDKVEKLMPPAETPMDKAEALAKEPATTLDSKQPQLNLQMQDKAAGVEKVVPKPEAKSAPKPAAPASVSSAPKAVAGGNVYVQLGAYRSKESAARDWMLLQKKYSAALKGLSMRTEKADMGKKGVLYRLQAGKVTEDRANDICKTLKAAGGGCMVVH